MSAKPFALTTSLHEKIWGVTDLAPWFRSSPQKIGEVWFSMPGPEPMPILVKIIATSDRLSVQVHPDEAYAQAHEGCGGKTEMWYVLDAAPGATLALGFREPISDERAREAAHSGEIESLLRWFQVSPGQTYFVPPGTVHALGAGITVCEIQRNNLITYRLYDYGRPRELHLDKALDVARLEPHPGPEIPGGSLLASCPYFVCERLELTQVRYQPDPVRFHLLVILEGGGQIGEQRFSPGQAWYVPAGGGPFDFTSDTRATLLRTYVP